MRVRFLLTVVLNCGCVTLAAAKSRGWDSDGPGPKDFVSERIKFTSAALMLSPSKGIALGFELENRSESPLWVKLIVRGKDSVIVCDQAAALVSKGRATIVCPSDTIAPEFVYPITVEIYPDSTMASVTERGGTQVRFRKKDLDELGVLKAATSLPRVYKDVVYKKKLGLATAVFGQLGPPSEGTLTASSDGIEWKSKKQTVHVPAAQIRAVKIERVGPRSTDAWVVVEYDEGGASKLMVLQPSAFRGHGPDDVPNIFASLQAVAGER